MFQSIRKFMSPQNMTFTTTNNKKKREPHSVLMAGLDAVGKTQLMHKLKYNKTVSTTPSLDTRNETITVHDAVTDITTDFNVTILTGFSVQHGYTLQYLQRLRHQRKPLPAAIVFVVDSVRPETLYEAKEVLWAICETYEALAKEQEQEQWQAGSLVLLVFANKQDSEGAMSIPDVKDSLDLEGRASKSMRWHIRGTETCFGSGIREGFVWLDTQLQQQ